MVSENVHVLGGLWPKGQNGEHPLHCFLAQFSARATADGAADFSDSVGHANYSNVVAAPLLGVRFAI
jgi:hypothetical protein